MAATVTRVAVELEDLKLVADERRLLMLRRLVAGGEVNAKELAAELGLSIPNVSYHVGVIREHKLAGARSGLLEESRKVPRRGAVQRWYRLRAGRAEALEVLIAAADLVLEARG